MNRSPCGLRGSRTPASLGGPQAATFRFPCTPGALVDTWTLLLVTWHPRFLLKSGTSDSVLVTPAIMTWLTRPRPHPPPPTPSLCCRFWFSRGLGTTELETYPLGMQVGCPRTMGLGRHHLEVGQQSDITLLCSVMREPRNIGFPLFRAFPSQVQPLILMGTGRSVPLPPRTSLPRRPSTRGSR